MSDFNNESLTGLKENMRIVLNANEELKMENAELTAKLSAASRELALLGEKQEELKKNTSAEEVNHLKYENQQLINQIMELKQQITNITSEKVGLEMELSAKKNEYESDIQSFSKQIGELMVEAHVGAKKILDQAKNEAERLIREAKTNAEHITVSAVMENDYIFKNIEDTEAQFAEAVKKLNEVSDILSNSKKRFKKADPIELPGSTANENTDQS